MGHFYSVKALKRGCKIRIRAKDSTAKQVLFGWGSDRGPSIEFYGRGTHRGAGDNEVWEWNLSRAGVVELRKNLAEGQERGKERRAARALLKKLAAASKRLGAGCGLSSFGGLPAKRRGSTNSPVVRAAKACRAFAKGSGITSPRYQRCLRDHLRRRG